MGRRECLGLPAGEWWVLSGISAFLCTRAPRLAELWASPREMKR
jgi:hypothetical protein